MTASYINGNKGQDGSVENLKYFDYSYGKGKVTVMVLLHQVALI